MSGARRFGKVSSGRYRQARERPTRSRFLLVVEGEVSEIEYFDHVKGAMRTSRAVEIRAKSGDPDPSRLVKKALELRSQEAAAKGADSFDEVWVVFDVDQHSAIPAAIALAGSAGIQVALSNPCFEIWLLMHCDSIGGHMTTAQAGRAWQKASSKGDKRIDISLVRGKFGAAEEQAQQSRSRHLRAGNQHPHDNPTTNVDELVRNIVSSVEASTGRTMAELTGGVL